MIVKAALAVLLAVSAGAVPVDLRILTAASAPLARTAAPPPDNVDT